MKVAFFAFYLMNGIFHGRLSFISDFEIKVIDQLVKQFGYDWAVRITDLIVIFSSLLFALCLYFFFLSVILGGRELDYTIRFSDKMNGFTYIWAERGGIKELVVKRPVNFLERVEVIIAFFWLRFFDKIPLREKNTRRMAIVIIVLIILTVISMIIFVLFALNVVDSNDLS